MLVEELYPLSLELLKEWHIKGVPRDLGKGTGEHRKQVLANLVDYSLSIPDAVPSVNMAVSEFSWRNGWFLAQAKTPFHVKLLEEIGLSSLVDGDLHRC